MLLIIALGTLTTALGVGFGWTVLELTMRALERSLNEQSVKRIPVHRALLRNGPLA